MQLIRALSLLMGSFSDQCRRKKIKCDGLAPVCSNCQAFNLECSYNDTTKKVSKQQLSVANNGTMRQFFPLQRGPPKGYIEAIENRLHKLERLLQELADGSDDPRSKAVLAELHSPLETASGEQIRTRPVRRGRGGNKNRTFLWQSVSAVDGSSSSNRVRPQQSVSTPTPGSSSAFSSAQLMDSPTLGHEEQIPSSPGSVDDSNGQLSMDESGQVRYLGKSSGFYLLQNSRTYQNGPFHLAGWGHKSSSSTAHKKPGPPLDPLELPPRDLSAHLLQLYFKHFYPVLPLFFKKHLVSSADNPAESVSPLLLNAIYAVASRMSPDLRVRSDPASEDTAGDIFIERAKCLLDDYYDVPRISTVQALLLMASHQHGAMKSTRAWVYSGMVRGLRVVITAAPADWVWLLRRSVWHRILGYIVTVIIGISRPMNENGANECSGAASSWIVY